jgi:hypothetical protein
MRGGQTCGTLIRGTPIRGTPIPGTLSCADASASPDDANSAAHASARPVARPILSLFIAR